MEVDTSAGLEPGDAGVPGQEMAGSRDDHLGGVRVEQEGVACLQLCQRPCLSKL